MRLRRYEIVERWSGPEQRAQEARLGKDTSKPVGRRFFFRLNAERVADKMTLAAKQDGLWKGCYYDVIPP